MLMKVIFRGMFQFLSVKIGWSYSVVRHDILQNMCERRTDRCEESETFFFFVAMKVIIVVKVSWKLVSMVVR